MAIKYQDHRGSSWKLLIVPALIVCLAGLLLWSQRDVVLERLGLEVIEQDDEDSMMWMVGDEVTLSGALESSQNIRHYTMVLDTVDGAFVGLKSTVLDLSSYRDDTVIVRGRVIDIINNIPVVNVVSLVSNEIGDTITIETEAQYVATAGLIVDPALLGEYDVASIGSDEVIFMTPEGQEVVLRYFPCTDTNSAATGCAYVMKQLSTAESRFTGTDGDERVQLPETNARFGSNDDRIGYRIADVDKTIVTDIMNGVTFVNDRYVTRYLMNDAKEACQTIDHRMSYVADTVVSYLDSEVVDVVLEGTDTEGYDVSCEVRIDPRTYAATLVSINGEEGMVDESDENGDTENDSDTDDEDNTVSNEDDIDTADDVGSSDVMNTDPAPALETPLPFTSSKGYTIIFPSSNIAFQGVNNTESLGIDGVAGCWTQMNVVHFDSATDVLDNPAIVMYDCIDVDDEVGSFDDYIRKDGDESGKIFFIDVLNEDWREFADNIEVQ